MLLLNLFAALLLIIASAMLIRKLLRIEIIQGKPDKTILSLVVLAEILLCITLFNNTLLADGINISFFNIFTLTAFFITLIYASATVKQPVEVLGILILPTTAFGILLQILNPQTIVLPSSSLALQAHILLSLLAYSLLSIAACQAVLLSIQNSFLKKKQTGGFLRSIPALESMENLLFQSIGLGFILLSLALFSGFAFLDDIFAQHLVHKTVLSLCAWVIFAFLLWGRFTYGWRGKKAIKLSLGGFIFLMLSYFGSKFVSELILHI
ncbi:MAG: cytochrome c biogenesis protein CcsA [Pseudomonadota bacterium]